MCAAFRSPSRIVATVSRLHCENEAVFEAEAEAP